MHHGAFFAHRIPQDVKSSLFWGVSLTAMARKTVLNYKTGAM
jgi:hypothetical protein